MSDDLSYLDSEVERHMKSQGVEGAPSEAWLAIEAGVAQGFRQALADVVFVVCAVVLLGLVCALGGYAVR